MKWFLTTFAAASIVALTVASSSAMPINNLATAAPTDLQDVRLVCTRSGRCYQTRPSYRARYAPRAYYAPSHRHRHGHAHGHAYGHRSPAPGVGVNLRF
jgi:hypothetical protein